MAYRRGPPFAYRILEPMKLTITKKLFFTIILVTACVIGLIVVFTKASIGNGFGRYLARVELRKVEPVARHIENLYKENGNWEFLETKPELVWREMQQAMAPREALEKRRSQASLNSDEDFIDAQGVPRAPQRRHFLLFHPLGIPPHIMELLHRVSIFNADKNRLWGEGSANLAVANLPLTVDGKQVGYIALAPGASLYSEIESNFVDEQNRNLLLIALAGFCAATIASMMLSSHLLSGIKALSKGTHKLASLDFSTRLDTTSSDEIGELAKDFNFLAETLEKQDQKSKQWVSDTSHELRTPIAILRAQVEAFQDGVQQVNPKTLAVLHKEIMSLSKLVDDLYWLARFDVGKLTDTLMPMDVIVCLQDALFTFEERFKDKNITVDTSELADSEIVINADRNRIKQVFMNLLENSLRYTDNGGIVKLGTSIFGEVVTLKIEDSAPAVPRAALPQIFERFFRVESSRSRDFGGAGLGLAICKSIIEAHDGFITATPSVLGGLKIEMKLPLAGNDKDGG